MKRKYMVSLTALCALLAFSGCEKAVTGSLGSSGASGISSDAPVSSDAVTSAESVDASSALLTSSGAQSDAPSSFESVVAASSRQPASSRQTSTSSKKVSSAPVPTSSQPKTPSLSKASTPTSSAASKVPQTKIDVQVYVDYAIAYGTSIGLDYDTTITDLSWNTPVNIDSRLTDATMKKNIRGACDVIKREGGTGFNPHMEKQSDSIYQLYLYYG